jgi:hypothetical protein
VLQTRRIPIARLGSSGVIGNSLDEGTGAIPESNNGNFDSRHNRFDALFGFSQGLLHKYITGLSTGAISKFTITPVFAKVPRLRNCLLRP